MKGIEIIQGNMDHRDKILQLMVAQLKEHAIDVDERELSNVICCILEDSFRGIFLIARNSQNIVGVAYLSFMFSLENPGKCAWLEELFVVPEYRGQGIGSLLVDEALKLARKHGCTAVDLEVENILSWVEKIYQRKGFKKLSRTRWNMVLRMKNDTHGSA